MSVNLPVRHWYVACANWRANEVYLLHVEEQASGPIVVKCFPSDDNTTREHEPRRRQRWSTYALLHVTNNYRVRVDAHKALVDFDVLKRTMRERAQESTTPTSLALRYPEGALAHVG